MYICIQCIHIYMCEMVGRILDMRNTSVAGERDFSVSPNAFIEYCQKLFELSLKIIYII